jgi:hypothetical protein
VATSIAGPNQLLADIQVTGLAAGQTGFNSMNGVTNTSGQNSIQMTPNSCGYTSPYTNTYWHGLYLDVEPGVLNAGQTEPDLQLWFHIDGVDYSSYFYVDISVSKNMLPHRDNTLSRQYVALGNSMYEAAYTGNFGRGNLPLVFTGPKIGQTIDFWFASTAGFTTSPTGTFASPPTIKLWGDVYDAPSWNYVVQKLGSWNGSISMQSERRNLLKLPSYSAVHVASLDFTNGFLQLPDGPKQGAVRVHRYMKFATPLNAVSGTSPYPLTSLVQSVGGKAGQVGQYNELGYKFAQNNNAVRISEFGRRPAAGAGYFGVTKGTANIYPTSTTYGEVDTPGSPRAWYGLQSPVTPLVGMYFKLPNNGNWNPMYQDKEVFAGEDIAYFVAAQNGQTITASTDYTAVGGVMVEA